jgi:hypothetical protein
MKAITIQPPFADLFFLPENDPRLKRVENRDWEPSYRGPMLIHSGKSKKWLKQYGRQGLDESQITFGALLGYCELAEVVRLSTGTLTIGLMIVNGVEIEKPGTRVIKSVPDIAKRRWPWLESHKHAHGPLCWVFINCRKFLRPIPYAGKQGIFNVPDEVVQSAFRTARGFIG